VAATKTTARKSRTKTTAKATSIRKPQPARRGGKPGKQTLLTPENAEAILETLRNGNYFETAVRRTGIGLSTVYDWLARGRRERERMLAVASEGVVPEVLDEERIYLEFLNDCEKADADAEIRAVLVEQKVMLDAVKYVTIYEVDEKGVEHRRTITVEDYGARLAASQSFRERRYPKRWSRGERQEVEIGGQLTQTVISVDEESQRAERVLDTAIEVGAFIALDVAMTEEDEDADAPED
jgi:transposase